MTETLAGRYQIIGKLGDGGFATVYRAEDTVLGRTVAVKIPHEQYAADPEFRRRFLAEARAAASLSHPHVVGLFDMGESIGRPFLVMEYVEGITLKELLGRGPLPIPQAVEIAVQSCEAVAAAHAQGIVHRDIKPQNILLKGQSLPDPGVAQATAFVLDGASSVDIKLADFGIARLVGTATVSETSQLLGSVHYMAPERIEGKAATTASDVYSLGVVLYEALAGQPPFDAGTMVGIALQHVREAPPLPRQLNPNISPRLEGIVLKAMAKEPRDRYASAEEMGQALQDYRQDAKALTGVVPVAARNNRTVSNGTMPPAHKRAPNELARFAAFLGILALVAVLGLTLLTATPLGNYLANLTIGGNSVKPSALTVADVRPPALDPVETLGRFYTLVDQRRFAESYELMGSKIKDNASLSVYTGWFGNKLSIHEETGQLVSLQGTEAEVLAIGWTSDRVPDGIRTWKFRERWKMVIENGAWRFDTRLETTQIDEGATPPYPTPTPCIVRQYPQTDASGKVYVVQQWCDGGFTSRLVPPTPTAVAPTPTPPATATPVPYISTEFRVNPRASVKIPVQMLKGRVLQGYLSDAQNNNIDFWIEDPSRVKVYDPGRVSGTHSFTIRAATDGTYNMVFDLSFSKLSGRTMRLSYRAY